MGSGCQIFIGHMAGIARGHSNHARQQLWRFLGSGRGLTQQRVLGLPIAKGCTHSLNAPIFSTALTPSCPFHTCLLALDRLLHGLDGWLRNTLRNRRETGPGRQGLVLCLVQMIKLKNSFLSPDTVGFAWEWLPRDRTREDLQKQ